jgi:seryl-tRNA synthetase
METNIFKEKWIKILDATRENYIQTIKSLTNHQQETENTIKRIIKEYNSMTKEQIEAAVNWVKETIKKREEYIAVFKNNLYESLEVMPNVEDFMLKKYFDELGDVVNSFYKNIYKNGFY